MRTKSMFAFMLGMLAATAVGLTIYVVFKIVADIDKPRSANPPKVAVRPQSPSAGKPVPQSEPAAPERRPEPKAAPAPQRAGPPAWMQAMNDGIAAYRDKRPEDARRLYTDALTAADKSGLRTARALVLSNTGSLYRSMRRLDQAEVYLLRATDITDSLGQPEITADPGSSQSLLVQRTERMLGAVFRDQGRDSEAVSRFGKAVAAARKLAGVNPDLIGMTLSSDLYEMASAQCRLGDLGAARSSVGDALKANPRTPSTAHQLKSLELLKAEIDKGRPCRR